MASPGCHEFRIVLDHLKPNFNVGKIFRSSEIFGAQGIDLVGVPFFDPFPSKGGFKRVPARFFGDFKECFAELEKEEFTIYVMNPSLGVVLSQEEFPQKSVFVVGHEEYGLSFNPAEYPQIRAIQIPQFGRIQSLNVSVAASIAMYEYVRQHSASVAISHRDAVPSRDISI